MLYCNDTFKAFECQFWRHGRNQISRTSRYGASTGLEGRGRSRKTPHSGLSVSFWPRYGRLDEPHSAAVNRETAHCDERKRVGFQMAHARPVGLPNTLPQQWQFAVRVLACQVGDRRNSGYWRVSRLRTSVTVISCFLSVGTRGTNSATLLSRSVYSTNTLVDFGVC